MNRALSRGLSRALSRGMTNGVSVGFAGMVQALSPALWLRGEDTSSVGGQFAHGYLSLPGRAGYYASTPDAAKYTPSVSLDLRHDGTFPTAANDNLLSQYNTSGSNRAWQFRSGGTVLNFLYSSDGATTANQSSSAHGVTATARYQYRVLAVLSGTITFFKRDPALGLAIDDDTNWTQVSTHSVSAFTIANVASVIEYGSNGGGAVNTGIMNGYAACIKVDGVTVASPNFAAQTTGTTSFSDAQSNTWTINGPLAADSSTNARDAALINGVTLGNTGRVTKTLTFDGVNDRGQVPSWTPASVNTTIAAWVNHTITDGNDHCIYSRSQGTTTRGHYLKIEATTGKLVMGVSHSTNGVTEWKSPVAINDDGSWNFVVGTFDGTTVAVYVNGVWVAGGAATGTAANRDATIGAFDDTTPAKFFTGGIDELIVVERALTAAEIADLYAAS